MLLQLILSLATAILCFTAFFMLRRMRKDSERE